MGKRKLLPFLVCFIICKVMAMNEEILQEFSSMYIPSSKKGSSELHEACKNGDYTLVIKIISMILPPDLCQSLNKYEFSDYINATINLRDMHSEAPIHIAVKLGSSEIIKYLLAHYARINLPGGKRNTPLHMAVKQVNLEIISILIEHGAEINKPNCYGNTPLHIACACRNEAMEQLARCKISLKLSPENIQEFNLISQKEKKLLDIIEVLLMAGAKIYIKNLLGKTALIHVLNDDVALVTLFTKCFFLPQCLNKKLVFKNTLKQKVSSLKELSFQNIALFPSVERISLPSELCKEFYEYLEPNLETEKTETFFIGKILFDFICERHFERFKYLVLNDRSNLQGLLFANTLVQTQTFADLPEGLQTSVINNILKSTK